MAEDMTRAVWDSLPEQYKRADAEQEPTPYPLLRWLAGPGSIMTRVREFADFAEDGGLTTVNSTNLNPDPINGHTTSTANYTSTNDDVRLVIDDGDPAIEVLENGAATALYLDPRTRWGAGQGLAPGKWLAWAADVKIVGGWMPDSGMIRTANYVGGTRSNVETIWEDPNASDYTRVGMASRVVDLPDGAYFRTLAWPTQTLDPGQGFRIRRFAVAVADSRDEAVRRVMEYRDVPAQILPWLARMLGIDPTPNTTAETRTAILSRASGSAPYIGTRKHIGDAAARVLGANAPLGVYPHPTNPWVIVVASDVESIANAGGLVEVWKKLTRLSVAPAGFYIIPMEARVTWDQFDNAKPPTWAEFDAAIRTWNQFDSVGVSFD